MRTPVQLQRDGILSPDIGIHNPQSGLESVGGLFLEIRMWCFCGSWVGWGPSPGIDYRVLPLVYDTYVCEYYRRVGVKAITK